MNLKSKARPEEAKSNLQSSHFSLSCQLPFSFFAIFLPVLIHRELDYDCK